jgi:hypothetical protein
VRRVSRSAAAAVSAAVLLAVGVGGSMTAQAAGKPVQAPAAQNQQTAGAHNPSGNNGTIKIDREAFDDAPNNEPHVGCVFQVDFYGYDKGDLHAQVIFEAHPPTLPTGSDRTLLTDTVFIGADDASGGGSQAGLDASRTYTLDLSGITPHPQQGVHVKLTIHADGSRGADVKHKVFWVTGCTSGTPTPSPTPSPSTPATPPASNPATPPPSTAGNGPPCTESSTDVSCEVVSQQPAFTG